MAIKYIEIPERRQIIAILNDTKFAAVDQIRKSIGNQDLMFIDTSKYLMKNSYKAVVTCQPEDDYDPEVGKKLAKEKVLKKYYNAVDSRCDRFVTDMLAVTSNVLSRFMPSLCGDEE